MTTSLTEVYDYVTSVGSARSEFYAGIVDAACQDYGKKQGMHEIDKNKVLDAIGAATIKQLNHSNVETLAQFLFLMKLFRLNNDSARLRRYLEGHNERLKAKLARLETQNTRYTASGKPASSLRKGLLHPEQINKMVDEADDMGLRYDQTSLGCLLAEVMSPATTRNLLILLSEFGFLRRIGNNTKVIRSLGVLERLYGDRVGKLMGEDVNSGLGEISQ
ncbi:hypothetical protein ROSMUCSMR3_04103 (plasmid) [Roseovarius mucosus]|uniref:Uncharacterized protein n=1 Tax=Roseovarius mucosus TaxID=215743 RepID=A0A1V0RV27_9RHOB|nr:hypothetical protein [Roseovarius mucosus]ARE85546.1 hypothetical protein ROSMUCSMR3_04103 [Roseovarius mucosus]PKQ10466.1 MAG: hypothetical protein CVT70_19590 [Alphaproteobacteria bacterium HGW-Alphaproteobacteria-1]